MRPIRLLTTRLKTAMAVGLTGLVFALSIPQELHPVYTKSSWLFRDGVPHSWLALAGDIAMYACLCLTGFYAAYVTRGRERLIIIGWLGFCCRQLEHCARNGPYQSGTWDSLGKQFHSLLPCHFCCFH